MVKNTTPLLIGNLVLVVVPVLQLAEDELELPPKPKKLSISPIRLSELELFAVFVVLAAFADADMNTVRTRAIENK